MSFNNCVGFIICCLGLAKLNFSTPASTNISQISDSTIDNYTMVKADTSTEKRFSLPSRYQSQGTNNFDTRKQIDGSLNLRSLDNISKRSQLVDSPELEEIILGKRQDCALPPNMRQNVSDLYRKLNNTFFLGGNQGPSEHKFRPGDQLLDCKGTDWKTLESWRELNSRTICPWVLTELDAGVDTYPRYFEHATCVCVDCIGGGHSYCVNSYRPVEYFKFGGCLNGFAILQRKPLNISTHCFCDKPDPWHGVTELPNYNSEK